MQVLFHRCSCQRFVDIRRSKKPSSLHRFGYFLHALKKGSQHQTKQIDADFFLWRFCLASPSQLTQASPLPSASMAPLLGWMALCDYGVRFHITGGFIIDIVLRRDVWKSSFLAAGVHCFSTRLVVRRRSCHAVRGGTRSIQ